MTTPPEPADPRDRPPAGLPLLGLLAPLGLYLAQVALYLRHVNDDAFITFRYSRFLASGLGPYFNVGEHVEGYTNFLQMVLMALVFALGGEAAVPAAAKLLGIFCGAGALALAWQLTRELARDVSGSGAQANAAAFAAAALVAVFPGYALNSTSGLETTLLGFSVTLGVLLGARAARDARWRGAGFAWGAAVLTRPEALLVFAVFWVATALGALAGPPGDRGRVRRRLALDAGIVVAVVLGHVAFRYLAYDGELLPNTYYAKAEGFRGLAPWRYVLGGALAPFLGPAGVLLGLLGWWAARRELRRGLPLAAVALTGAALPLLMGSDWMPGWRFSVPYLPLLGCLVTLGWFRLLRPVSRRRARAGVLVAVVVVGGSAVWHHAERRELRQLIELRAGGYATGHAALASWVRDGALAPGETVALMDIGIVGYYCPRQRILDITGLTDRHIAKSPGPLLYKEYDPAYVLDRRPELIVLVISTHGDPDRLPPVDAEYGTWIPIERLLYHHPEFEQHYRAVREAPPGATWDQRLAARLGAERIFPHAFPGQYYLLAVFRRQPPVLR